MTRNLSLVSFFLLLSNYAFAQAEYVIDFSAKYTYAVWNSPPTFQLPVDTSVSVTFIPNASPTLSHSAGITSLGLASGNQAVSVDSPIFNALPPPQISWNSPYTSGEGEVRIERNDSTSNYRLVVVSDLSYSLGCILRCTNYFKAVTLISDYSTGFNYSPFDDTARFIGDLYLSGTSFESNLIQDSWYRVSGRDYYSGASLSTSYNTLGFGQYWQGGNAKIASLTTPVPEPDIYLLLLAGISFLGYRVRSTGQVRFFNGGVATRPLSGVA